MNISAVTIFLARVVVGCYLKYSRCMTFSCVQEWCLFFVWSVHSHNPNSGHTCWWTCSGMMNSCFNDSSCWTTMIVQRTHIQHKKERIPSPSTRGRKSVVRRRFESLDLFFSSGQSLKKSSRGSKRLLTTLFHPRIDEGEGGGGGDSLSFSCNLPSTPGLKVLWKGITSTPTHIHQQHCFSYCKVTNFRMVLNFVLSYFWRKAKFNTGWK